MEKKGPTDCRSQSLTPNEVSGGIPVSPTVRFEQADPFGWITEFRQLRAHAALPQVQVDQR